MKKVYVGMSGGVDSSVTAALLIKQGYDVTGVFMKNWAQDLPGFKCPWREDLADAKRVAVQLGIPFKIYDFQKEYRQRVVDYMITEYQAGRTPNPDIMCNQEVKFKLFLETALDDGADLIATGHYAQAEGGRLLQAADANKDQTYFLYRVTQEALSKTLFPLGGMTKPEVRERAKGLGLVTAQKKDSVGICFVGEIGIKEFLLNFVETAPGAIIEQASGQTVGQHEGAIFYTIGQRHGLNIGGGLPYYVIGKDMRRNEVYVTTNLDDEALWRSTIALLQPHWINSAPVRGDAVMVRTRHRAALESCVVESITDEQVIIKARHPIRAVTEGQSAVLYSDDYCLGGGIIL